MTKDQARQFFGNYTKLAKALGIKQPSISLWGEYPPLLRQLQLEALTGGKLKAEPDAMPPMATNVDPEHRSVNSPAEIVHTDDRNA